MKYSNDRFTPRDFCILIAEDIKSTLELLCYELENNFAEVSICPVQTVVGTLEHLDRSVNFGPKFDVAIIDFKLPYQNIGDTAETSTEISSRFQLESPETVLVHITAFKDDPQVKRFIERNAKYVEAGRLFISKDGDWVKQLRDELARCLHTRRIRGKLMDLFGTNTDTYERERSLRSAHNWRSDRARSLAIADLCEDAQEHWEQVPDSLRVDLKQVLGYRQDEQGMHCVGVFDADEEPPQEPLA